MTFDLIFVLIFIWAAYRGFTRGFIMQITTLAALILGIYFAIRFSEIISTYMSNKYAMTGEYLPVIFFALTLLILVIGIYFIGKMIEHLVEAIALGIINRLLGVVFSLIKYALLISAILVILNATNRTVHFLPEKKLAGSHLYRPLSMLVPALFPKLFNTIVPPVNLPVNARQEKIV
jgi:membrane protein required for colicin V production